MEVINALGRRKAAIARVYGQEGNGKITVNGQDYKEYFDTAELQLKVTRPFVMTETNGQYDIKANLRGGGITGQAEALRLAIARFLVKVNEEHRATMKPESLLTRDPRMVERKKFGQKKARKKFQFSKR